MQKLLLGILLLTAIILQGCATSARYNYKYQSMGVDPSFIIMDNRPEQEKKSKIMSIWITNEKYGIYRLGDAQVIPDRIMYLKEQLYEKAGEKLASKKIEVNHFVIYNDMHACLTRNAIVLGLTGAIGGAVDAVAVKQTADAFIVTELELTVDSQYFSTRIEMPYIYSKIKGIKKEALAAHIKQSMDEAIAELITEMQSNLGPIVKEKISPQSTKASGTDIISIETKLKELAKMKSDGLINDSDYSKLKAKILDKY